MISHNDIELAVKTKFADAFSKHYFFKIFFAVLMTIEGAYLLATDFSGKPIVDYLINIFGKSIFWIVAQLIAIIIFAVIAFVVSIIYGMYASNLYKQNQNKGD